MVLDERSRHALYLRLEEVLGSDAATTMMELLPPVGWADVATRRDLDAMRQELRAEFAVQTRTIVLALVGTTVGVIGTNLAAIALLR